MSMGPRAEPRAAMPGQPRLPERYEPVRVIASGGSAVVWCAEDHLLDRRVAVKLLADPYLSDPAAVRRFKREARAAARLSGHPHVVTIFDVGETEQGVPFIVMEHLAGGTVADALRLGAVTLDDAVRWLHETASAIDYAHSKGILHRDIKPANLLLDPHRTLHVADFGIAQIGHEDTLTLSGQVLGTASYLAPERVLGRPATVASDLYSLAVAGFEMLAGERPFTQAAYVAQARAHLELEPPAASERNPSLPPGIDAVLARGLAKREEDRWPSAEAFAVAVERALAPNFDTRVGRSAAVLRGQRVAAARARGDMPARPARRPRSERSRRDRWGSLGLIAGAAASAALVVGGIAWATSGGSPKHPHLAAATAHPPARISSASSHRSAAKPKPPAPKKPTTTPTVTAQPAATTTPPPTADELAAQGHSLIDGGNPSGAIPLLQKAVADAAPGSLTYAYALYDLGHAYLLAGDPTEAVKILAARLKIPNQTAVVTATLGQALQELGQRSGGVSPATRAPASPGSPAPAPPAPGPGHPRRGHGPGDRAAASRD